VSDRIHTIDYCQRDNENKQERHSSTSSNHNGDAAIFVLLAVLIVDTGTKKRIKMGHSDRKQTKPKKQSLLLLMLWMFCNPSTVVVMVSGQSDGMNNTNSSAYDDILEQQYNMSGPVFHYENYSFTLDFTVSDYIEDGAVEYRLYDGHNCKDGGLGADVWNNETKSFEDVGGDTDITDDPSSPLNARLRTDLTPIGDGTGSRLMKVTLDMDGELLPNSTIYRPGNTSGIVEFCLRFGVYNKPRILPDSYEVNFIEVPVRLTISLMDDFTTELTINDVDLVIQLAYEDNAVEAYLCDNDANIVSFGSASQGEDLRVCIIPTDESLAQGAFLRQIEEFTFRRDNYTQVAVAPLSDGQPYDELTVVSCYSGATVCAFETLLNADFFREGVGVVYGSGTAYMQLGDDVITESIRNRHRTRRRGLQKAIGAVGNDLLAARPTTFQLQVVVVPEGSDADADGGLKDTLWDGGTSDGSYNGCYSPRNIALFLFLGAATSLFGFR
jgi:hypothetical protein